MYCYTAHKFHFQCYLFRSLYQPVSLRATIFALCYTECIFNKLVYLLLSAVKNYVIDRIFVWLLESGLILPPLLCIPETRKYSHNNKKTRYIDRENIKNGKKIMWGFEPDPEFLIREWLSFAEDDNCLLIWTILRVNEWWRAGLLFCY